MLIPHDIHKNIGDIIERSYTDFTYQLLGKDFLTEDQIHQVQALGLLVGQRPLLELVYLLVKQRAEERYQTDRTLTELLQEIFATGILPDLPETAQATIDTAMAAMNQIIERTKAEVTSVISQQITTANREEQQRVRERGEYTVVPAVYSPDVEEKNIAKLMVAVGAALLVVGKTFHRDFTGEFTTLVNNAVVDAAFELKGAQGGDQLCYKKVMNDSRICFHCHGHYVAPDGTPKIYKLRELIANGSNQGKPRSAWRPVIENDHPRCRCQLILIPRDSGET